MEKQRLYSSCSDVGSFNYGITQKPYAVSAITPASNHIIPSATQEIDYTSFHRPDSIEEGNRTAAFVYDENYERAKMTITANGASSTTYYLGGCYEVTVGNTPQERLYLGGDFYSAPYVCEQPSSSSGAIRYLLRDNQGSITHVVATNGQVLQELSYDAWGRLRNPATQQVYACDSLPTLYLGRGYTGHEHLTGFNLINMNARLYDPALGRFLSPDPYVQAPENSQNFNRYSYCLNNPLRYTDKTGNFFLEATLFGYMHGSINALTRWENPFKGGIKFLKNEINIFKGQFASNNKHFWGKVGDIASRFFWQQPQSFVGTLVAQTLNHVGMVTQVDQLYGATVVSTDGFLGNVGETLGLGTILGDNWGMTLSNTIVGGKNLAADPNNALFQHEYGHYLQSQSMGPLYLFVAGVPSICKGTYVEHDANVRSFEYLNRHVNGFYISQQQWELSSNKYIGWLGYGWNFWEHPLKETTYPQYSYVDYYNNSDVGKLTLIYKLFHF